MGIETLLRPTVQKLLGFEVLPETKEEFVKYIAKHDNIAKYLQRNPEYVSVLQEVVDTTFQKYRPYLQRRVGRAMEKGADAYGLLSDAYFFINPIGGLGGKFLSTIGKTAADFNAMVDYSTNTGDYLAIPKLLAAKVASYVPGLNELVDSSLTGIIKRRMTHEVQREFLKKVDAYKTPTEMLANQYTKSKERAGNIFRPQQFQPA